MAVTGEVHANSAGTVSDDSTTMHERTATRTDIFIGRQQP